MKEISKIRQIIGWLVVAISLLFTCIWTYWGIVENFHEGWYSPSVLDNLFMLLIQYMSITIIFVGLAITSLKWPKAGLIVHVVLAIFLAWFFSGASFSVVYLMITIPLILLGIGYYVGRPRPKKWAYRLLIILPLVIIVAVTPINMIKISQRVNDGDFGMRTVEGNGVTLIFAPRGPGWPDKGVTYDEAVEICKYLSEDGLTVMDDVQNIWRLPSVDEFVRCMSLHNENCQGVWDPIQEEASYKMTPDKETPLWDPHSKVIYYWTADIHEERSEYAYIVVYHGGIFDKRRDSGYSYISFRAVKDTDEN